MGNLKIKKKYSEILPPVPLEGGTRDTEVTEKCFTEKG
jgi:hypothetical protein